MNAVGGGGRPRNLQNNQQQLMIKLAVASSRQILKTMEQHEN